MRALHLPLPLRSLTTVFFLELLEKGTSDKSSPLTTPADLVRVAHLVSTVLPPFQVVVLGYKPAQLV
jgi:hypothetical protein